MNITYKQQGNDHFVYKDGKLVGKINHVGKNFIYSTAHMIPGNGGQPMFTSGNAPDSQVVRYSLAEAKKMVENHLIESENINNQMMSMFSEMMKM